MNKNITELIPIYDNRKSFYDKAKVKEEDDCYILISYDTLVFKIYKDKREPVLLWNEYSNTTYHHINEFLQQYTDYCKTTKQQIMETFGDNNEI